MDIDALDIIRKYKDKLSDVEYQVIVLQCQVEILQAELEELKGDDSDEL